MKIQIKLEGRSAHVPDVIRSIRGLVAHGWFSVGVYWLSDWASAQVWAHPAKGILQVVRDYSRNS